MTLDFAAKMIATPEVKAFPTIRAQMGDWYYYMTTLPFYEVARRVLPATEFFHPSNLNEWIQREVMPRRRTEIAGYLIREQQRFFNGIVLGLYLGEPKWYEIEVAENNLFGTPGLDPRFRQALGILELTGEERLYAIDGQHRVAGIKEALETLQRDELVEQYNTLAHEDLGIVLVAADKEGDQLKRVRRMFSTLNKTARPVSAAELIALDEDDAGAIVTRRIATEFEDLNRVTPVPGRRPDMSLIHLGKNTQLPKANRHSISTIVTLLDVVRSSFREELTSLKSKYQGSRPTELEIDALYENAIRMWKSLRDHSREMANVMGSEPGERRAGFYRGEDGGHVLFRPIGQQAFSGALGVLRSRGISTEDAVANLSLAPMELSQLPWVNVMWNPITNRMVNSYRTLGEALFLHMVGEPPRSPRYDLEARYQDVYGPEKRAPFQDLPVFSGALSYRNLYCRGVFSNTVGTQGTRGLSEGFAALRTPSTAP